MEHLRCPAVVTLGCKKTHTAIEAADLFFNVCCAAGCLWLCNADMSPSVKTDGQTAVHGGDCREQSSHQPETGFIGALRSGTSWRLAEAG